MGLLTDRIRQGESGTWRKRLSDKEEDERLTPEQREEIQANRRKVVAGAALVGGIAVLLNSRDAAGSLLSSGISQVGNRSPQYLYAPPLSQDPMGVPGGGIWSLTNGKLRFRNNALGQNVDILTGKDTDNFVPTPPAMIVAQGPNGGVANLYEEFTFITGISTKKLQLDSYINSGTGNQAINFVTPFNLPPTVLANATGVSIAVTVNGITLISPQDAVARNGLIVVEGQ